MQKITLIGRLGRDAAVREGQSGRNFVSFTVAANSRVRGVEKTSWYDAILPDYESHKNLVPYLKKGSSVVVVGDFDADIEKGNDGQYRCRRTVRVDSIEFNSNGTSGSTSNGTTTATAPAPAEEEPTVTAKKPAKKAAAVPEPVAEAEEDNQPEDDLPF